jgi:hypothetical protein
MAKVRAYGADSTLLACRETSYGVAPVSGYTAHRGGRSRSTTSFPTEKCCFGGLA